MLHPFERVGLGKAPFRYAGFERKVFVVPGCEARPGASCHYCGTAISNVFNIQSSDNCTFHVGSECVRKLAKESNLKSDPVIVKILAEKRLLDRKVRREREERKITQAKAQFDEHRAVFEQQPHPVKWRADKGETLADQIDWYFAHAGNSGKLQMARLIAKMID